MHYVLFFLDAANGRATANLFAGFMQGGFPGVIRAIVLSATNAEFV